MNCAKRNIFKLLCIMLLTTLLPLPAFGKTDKSLLQFRSGGHILGFMPDRFYIASGSYALRIEFMGTDGVPPDAPGYAGESGSTQIMPLTSVTYQNLWKGINLMYEQSADEVIKSTYHVAPYADPGNIRLKYNVPVELQADGSLRMDFETGYLSESPPVAWQEIDGQKVPVSVKFCQWSQNETGFALGNYDPSFPLIIDPFFAMMPTIQASAVNFTSVTNSSMSINWTNGNGAFRIVLMKAGTAVDSDPVIATTYTANAAFAGGAQIGTGNYVVYSGSGSSVNVTGLTSETAYHIAVYEFNGSGGIENYLTTSPAIGSAGTLPRVITLNSVTSVSSSSVVADATADGTDIAERGFYWWNAADSSGLLPAGFGAGDFSLMLTGLKPQNTYNVKAYIRVGTQIISSDPLIFTTKSPRIPVVHTSSQFMLNGSDIDVSGEITDVGNSLVLIYGFVYANHPAPTVWDKALAIAWDPELPLSTGKLFSGTIRNLAPGTYYLRSYAHNNAGTAYGEEITFTIYAPGFTVSPSTGLTTSESGASATFTVKINTQPTVDVTLNLSSSDTTEGIISPASLTFTTQNWNTPQSVTVKGIDDYVADGNQSYKISFFPAVSTDSAYNGLKPDDVPVINTDNDTPGFTVSPTGGLTTSESGASAAFSVRLNTQPSADVTVNLSSSDTTEGTVSPASLLFTSQNWNAFQTVTVIGVDDSVIDGDQSYKVILSSAISADSAYNGLKPDNVPVINTDNDTPGFTVSLTGGLTTSESGASAAFSVRLNTQPSADVTLNLSSSDTTEGTVSPASLIFTSLNWDIPLTITVTGVDDSMIDGDQTYSVILSSAISVDSAYNDLKPDDVSVVNLDNEPPPVNHAPVVNADNYSVNQDNVLNIAAPGVLTNDTDADKDSLTAMKVSDPANGVLSFSSNGSFIYTPKSGFYGQDSFTYKANDGKADSAAVAVKITVNYVPPYIHPYIPPYIPPQLSQDNCPNDPDKTEPGKCGCGVSDTDTDKDGVPDCLDKCPLDPQKTEPGKCGCGIPDTDSDKDGVPDCLDKCPNDPQKTEPGKCGCNVPDIDTDGDGIPDCKDLCPNYPNKTDPGKCGCGIPDTDTDKDGVPDCKDLCPNDPKKTELGICGCGIDDKDSDGDGVPDCKDKCPNDPKKTEPGKCGCGVPDIDSDGDGVPDCKDSCLSDPKKTDPGICGCGIPDTDSKGDGIADCLRGDPPKTPVSLSPEYQSVIPADRVTLTAGQFSASGNQTHSETHWLLRRADTPEKDAFFTDFMMKSGDLTSYNFAEAFSGMKYFWKVGYKDSGNIQVSWSSVSSFIVGTLEQSVIIEIPPGGTVPQYQMFSIPYWTEKEELETVLGAIIGNYDIRKFRIGAYDAQTGRYTEYGESLKMMPGRAYWILSKNGLKISFDGVPVSLNHTIGVVLDSGWNMVSPPNYADYDWSKVEIIVYDDNGKLIYGPAPVSAENSQNYIETLWQWQNGDYMPADTLEKTRGYWVKAKQSGVVLRFPESARGKSAIRSEKRSGSAEKPPLPMGNIGFSVNSDTEDTAGGCFIDAVFQRRQTP